MGGYKTPGIYHLSQQIFGYQTSSTRPQINANNIKMGLLKKGNMKTVKLQEKDGVSKDYQMVYRMASMESYMNGANFVGFVASIVSVGTLPLILIYGTDVTYMEGLGSFGFWECLGLWGFLLNHALAGYYCTYKIPIRIYYSQKKDNFMIVYNHALPWKKSIIAVNDGGIQTKLKYENKDIFYLNNYRHKYLTNGRVLYVGYNFFSSPFYYKKLLGINTEEFDD